MGQVEVDQNGSTVSVGVGDDIVVHLAETPTTGYQWKPSTVDDRLSVVESAYVPGGDAPGAGGERIVRLRATSVGEADAEFELRRQWETEPARRFALRASIS